MNTNFISSKTISTVTKKMVLIFIILFSGQYYLNAQAKLSIQGIIKRSNGAALEDGTYPIKFNIYAKNGPNPNAILWDEVITDVDVNGGVYSEILGDNTSDPLTLPFDQDYLLGIEIGGKEMLPRIELTSAPYALSIRGQSNLFPSAGQVQADRLKVAEGVTVNKGAPLVNNTDGSKGYSFNGDNDSGVFSNVDGEVSIYLNGVEKLKIGQTASNHTGTLTSTTLNSNQLNLFENGGISYAGTQGQFNGWRLADVDDFISDDDGWAQTSKTGNEFTGWNNCSGALDVCSNCITNLPPFVGNVLIPNVRENVLKKQFTIAGSFSEIKVKFRFYAFNTWDSNDFGYGGFATSLCGDNLKIAWVDQMTNMGGINGFLNTPAFIAAVNIRDEPSNSSDYWKDVEMSAKANGNSFWVFIGAAMEGGQDEGYGIGAVEIWVR